MAKVVWSWKAWTGRRIAKGLKGERAKPELADPKLGGPIWFREYWDRFVRNERHLQNVVDYIHQNPVKAGLVTKPEEWRWSSAWVDSSSSV
jgi:REP element-mobilizing transposase RayT